MPYFWFIYVIYKHLLVRNTNTVTSLREPPGWMVWPNWEFSSGNTIALIFIIVFHVYWRPNIEFSNEQTNSPAYISIDYILWIFIILIFYYLNHPNIIIVHNRRSTVSYLSSTMPPTTYAFYKISDDNIIHW